MTNAEFLTHISHSRMGHQSDQNHQFCIFEQTKIFLLPMPLWSLAGSEIQGEHVWELVLLHCMGSVIVDLNNGVFIVDRAASYLGLYFVFASCYSTLYLSEFVRQTNEKGPLAHKLCPTPYLMVSGWSYVQCEGSSFYLHVFITRMKIKYMSRIG